jgi:hypothetical protein
VSELAFLLAAFVVLALPGTVAAVLLRHRLPRWSLRILASVWAAAALALALIPIALLRGWWQRTLSVWSLGLVLNVAFIVLAALTPFAVLCALRWRRPP